MKLRDSVRSFCHVKVEWRKTNLTPYWIYSFNSNRSSLPGLNMVFTPSVGECYAYSLEYTGEPILRVLIFKGINMFPSIKSYRTENNCLV